ncbi:hypothetical protein PN435_18035, partial [Nodularia spumigena CS-590/02]|nr:hypothetical protein [Nodularia spumigena CS-590/02]
TQGGEIRYHDLPSIAEIAVAVGSSPDTVEKDLRKLRKLGLYEYRTVIVQGHNLTAAKAKAEAEHLSKSKTKINSPKSTQGKGSAYLSSDGDYLSPDSAYLSPDGDYLSPDSAYLSRDQSPEPLPAEDSKSPQNNQNYSNFIQTLSKEERANFLKFCEEKTKNLSQEVNDIEAWLAHTNKAGQNRWEVYYKKFLDWQQQQSQKPQSSRGRQMMQKFHEELEEQRQQAMQNYQNT